MSLILTTHPPEGPGIYSQLAWGLFLSGSAWDLEVLGIEPQSPIYRAMLQAFEPFPPDALPRTELEDMLVKSTRRKTNTG